MTTAVMNYAVNPIWTFLKRVGLAIHYAFEVQGYARAAAELARQGYTKEAKELMLQLEKRRVS